MIWVILSSYLSGMPKDFESLSVKDAEVIMQAWADKDRNSRGLPNIGKLDFQWINWNGIDTCTVFFHHNGKKKTFMKIAERVPTDIQQASQYAKGLRSQANG